jgi:hypothetical protein
MDRLMFHVEEERERETNIRERRGSESVRR